MFTHFPELLLLKNINLKFFIKYYLKHFSESKDKTQLPLKYQQITTVIFLLFCSILVNILLNSNWIFNVFILTVYIQCQHRSTRLTFYSEPPTEPSDVHDLNMNEWETCLIFQHYHKLQTWSSSPSTCPPPLAEGWRASWSDGTYLQRTVTVNMVQILGVLLHSWIRLHPPGIKALLVIINIIFTHTYIYIYP